MTKFILAAALCLVGVEGCNKATDSLVPVEGKVTLNGNALADATVSLIPTRANGSGPYSGATDGTGRYTLGSGSAEGAAPGEYYLMIKTVMPLVTGDESTPQPRLPKEVVPPAYSSGTMKVAIPPEGSAAANFDMKSR